GPSGPSRRQERAGTAAAVVSAAALALVLVAWWHPGRDLAPWTPALWAVPFALLALAPPWERLRRGTLVPWLVIGWIAGTAAGVHLWIAHLDARLADAEGELARLGTEPDPYLEFLLQQFAEQVLLHAAEGESGVNLLYRSWVTGGLAAEGYEARITLWSGDTPDAELRLGEAAIPPELIPGMLQRARSSEEVLLERDPAHDSLHYTLLVPLPGERTVSVVIPPRRTLGRSTAIARFLNPSGDADAVDRESTLALVPMAPFEAQATGPPEWVRTPAGWQSEAWVRFPGGPLHAHLLVRTASWPLLGARMLLFGALLAVVFAAFWGVARMLAGDAVAVVSGGRAWVRSFRGRLTLALFGFFLLPLLLLGATVYQALAREVVRTAGALAERSLEQAEAAAGARSLAGLAAEVRSDLLLYQNGVLRAAAAPEVLELGLYPAWLPADVYLRFQAAEALTEREERRLGGNEYLIAYRRLGFDRVLASPTPLATGEIARRRQQLAEVVLLAVLLGAIFSVALALAVGRAFSNPIDRLSHAAASVGAGNLGVSLDERRRDEFGELFRSFNRMVRRLRRARAALLRETRRTEAIVAEAGTGIVALDPHGRVRLINPRAEEILGTPVPVGEVLPADTPLADAMRASVARFRDSGQVDGGDELSGAERIVRLRLRRLPAERGAGGTVAALEDISDEIRSARVLAWGEMARQVAHEIKNPLTPIKLAVQHLRRAHADRRPDFEQILERNVAAVLSEIDRLGEIARAFARFGTPPPAPGELERLRVPDVVEETLALYRGGADGVRYRLDAAADTPPVLARGGELKEVLVNLLENAREALDGGGEIRVEVRAEPAEGAVVLALSDTGAGIPPDALPHIWEPHFSTRSSGTGLGLAIVRRLVEGWGGEVSAESSAGEGTTVTMRLRIAP
ncbi:MAG: ATP-binding protein, partial [Gemmatimonadota bacterium]|nr:ATP-binding protein [Gemmatimonadota bacterium]